MTFEIQQRISEALLPIFVAAAAPSNHVDNACGWKSSQVPVYLSASNYAGNLKGSTTGEVTFPVSSALTPLSLAEEKEFHALAVKEALGTIRPVETKRLHLLDKRRLVDEKPVPAATIIARERLLSKIEALLGELNEFRRA